MVWGNFFGKNLLDFGGVWTLARMVWGTFFRDELPQSARLSGGHSASEGGRFRQISIVSKMLFFSLYDYFRLLYTCFQHQNLLYFNL